MGLILTPSSIPFDELNRVTMGAPIPLNARFGSAVQNFRAEFGPRLKQ
jgi:hypothetical protein